MRMVRRLGVLAVSAALMLGLALPAGAETYGDETGDVYSWTANSSAGYEPASGGPDISSVRAVYTTKTLTVAVTLTTSAKTGWNELWIRVKQNPKSLLTDPTTLVVRAKNGKILEVGRQYSSSSGIVPGGVTAKISGNTITVTADISGWFFTSKKIGFYTTITRAGAKNKIFADDYPSRDPSEVAGGALVQGNPKYQMITLSSAGRSVTTPTAKPTLSTKTIAQGKKATVTIAVTPKTAGKAVVFDGKTKLGAVKIKKNGKATFTLPKSLKVGKHKIAVKFTPKGGTAGKKIAAGTLTVNKK